MFSYLGIGDNPSPSHKIKVIVKTWESNIGLVVIGNKMCKTKWILYNHIGVLLSI
jgi:hypothetical protein